MILYFFKILDTSNSELQNNFDVNYSESMQINLKKIQDL